MSILLRRICPSVLQINWWFLNWKQIFFYQVFNTEHRTFLALGSKIQWMDLHQLLTRLTWLLKLFYTRSRILSIGWNSTDWDSRGLNSSFNERSVNGMSSEDSIKRYSLNSPSLVWSWIYLIDIVAAPSHLSYNWAVRICCVMWRIISKQCH